MGLLMGNKPVEYIREGHKGDHGWNPAKPRMVLINVPGQGQRLVPYEKLTVVKDAPAPVVLQPEFKSYAGFDDLSVAPKKATKPKAKVAKKTVPAKVVKKTVPSKVKK